jgi:hypothetical protein
MPPRLTTAAPLRYRGTRRAVPSDRGVSAAGGCGTIAVPSRSRSQTGLGRDIRSVKLWHHFDWIVSYLPAALASAPPQLTAATPMVVSLASESAPVSQRDSAVRDRGTIAAIRSQTVCSPIFGESPQPAVAAPLRLRERGELNRKPGCLRSQRLRHHHGQARYKPTCFAGTPSAAPAAAVPLRLQDWLGVLAIQEGFSAA